MVMSNKERQARWRAKLKRMAARAPTVDEMLAVPTTARPDRIDELLRRSEERGGDRFDLPPPDRPTEVVNEVGVAPQ